MEERKPKTHKGKLYLESLKPKLIEDPKQCLFINTENSTEIMRMVLHELYLMRKEFSKKLTRKEKIFNIVQNKENVEFLCTKNNTVFFSLSSHNKKHPMDLTIGCLYDHQLLDSFEFEVTNFIPMSYFKESTTINSDLKPIIIFQGELFESDFNYDRLKKFLIDYFQLYDKENIVISEMRRIIVVSIENDEKLKEKTMRIEIDKRSNETERLKNKYEERNSHLHSFDNNPQYQKMLKRVSFQLFLIFIGGIIYFFYSLIIYLNTNKKETLALFGMCLSISAFAFVVILFIALNIGLLNDPNLSRTFRLFIIIETTIFFYNFVFNIILAFMSKKYLRKIKHFKKNFLFIFYLF